MPSSAATSDAGECDEMTLNPKPGSKSVCCFQVQFLGRSIGPQTAHVTEAAGAVSLVGRHGAPPLLLGQALLDGIGDLAPGQAALVAQPDDMCHDRPLYVVGLGS